MTTFWFMGGGVNGFHCSVNVAQGVANGKFETLRDSKTILFLCRLETLSILKLRD